MTGTKARVSDMEHSVKDIVGHVQHVQEIDSNEVLFKDISQPLPRHCRREGVDTAPALDLIEASVGTGIPYEAIKTNAMA